MEEELKTKKELIEELITVRKKVKLLEKKLPLKNKDVYAKHSEALLKNQIRIENALSSLSSLGIVLLDREFKFIRVNDIWGKNFNKNSEDFIGCRFSDVFPKREKYSTYMIDAFNKIAKTKKNIILNARPFIFREKKGGEITYLDCFLQPLLDEKGEVEYIFFTSTNVTEQKKTKEQLYESEKRLNEAQHIAHIGSWELYLETNNLTWSDEIYSIFEIDPKRFAASYDAFLDLVHHDDREKVNTAYTDSVKYKTPYDITHRLLFPDGRIKYVHERCETYYNEEGKPIRSLGTVQDITARRLAEESQRKLNRELRAISNCNQTLLRATDEQMLLNEVCRIICEEAGYCLVWVGYIENNSKKMKPVAWAGKDSACITGLGIYDFEKEAKYGLGAVGKSIDDGEIVYVDDLGAEAKVDIFSSNAVKHGIRSNIVFPLKDDKDKVFGILSIYSKEVAAFTSGEIRLLEELAGDLAYGINSLRIRDNNVIASEKLQLAHQMTEKIFNNTHVMMAYLDTHFNFLKVNRAYAQADEKEISFFSGCNHFELYPNDENMRIFQNVVDTGEPYFAYAKPFEYAEHPERGKTYWDWNLEPIRGIDGKIEGLILSLLNVTDRIRAEEALMESQAKYIDLYDNAPDMYYSVNAKTALIENCNTTLANEIGCSKEEIMGRSVFNIYHKDSLKEAEKAFGLFVKTGEVRDQELQLIKKDGSKLDVSLNVTSVKDKGGSILYSRSTLHDITERKRNYAINSARLKLMQFSVTHSLDELLEETLNEAEKITDSSIGFYHFVEDDQKSLTLQNWSTRTKAEFCKAEGKGKHYDIKDAGVWVDCIRKLKPVIHNDYSSLPHRKGMPEGHAEVIRELVVPVIRGEKIKAILGVGNKPANYKDEDVEAISLLADLTWDIAERKMLDETFFRLNRELQAISNCNQTLLRAVDEQTLLNEICRIICNEAGYCLAWVGYVEYDEAKTVRPVAWAGDNSDYIKKANLSWSEDSERGRGPTGISVRTGEIVFVQDFETDPIMIPWRETARKHGYRSSIALPLKDENKKVFGVLMIYSDEANVITRDEIELMNELSGDLAFGITALRTRAERKQAETELHKSNTMLRGIIEAAPTAIYDIDLEGKVKTIWNPAAEKIFGWKSGEVLGKMLPTVPEEKMEEFKGLLSRVQSGEVLDGIDITRRGRNGSSIDCFLYASLLHDPGSRIIGSVSVLMDVTERKRIERRIQESESRFKELANLLPQTVFEADTSGNVTFANKAGFDAFGYMPEELSKGINIVNLVAEKDRKSAIRNLKNVLNYMSSQKNEYELVKRNGKRFPALTFTSSITREGKPVGVRGTIVDITEQKKIETELKKLSEAVEQGAASIVITDTNGNIEYVNKTFEKITGYSSNEIINKNCNIIQSGFTSRESYEDFWKTIKAGNTWRGEFQNKKKSGEIHWEDVTVSPIKDNQNNIINYLGVKLDITEKKRMTEELIIAKDQAEKSDRLKTEFLAQMSHEIRSPLNVIMSMVQLIKEEFPGKLADQISECFDSVDAAGERLIRTVELILNSAEMQIGTYEPVWENIDIEKDILSQLVAEYSLHAKKKGLSLLFTKKIAGSLIFGDRYSTNQIFGNLIDNAIKYTLKGVIEITISEEKGDKIMVVVEDTGIGISEDFLESLFEPFLQEERGYSRRFDGNGLGLSLIKKYCDLNKAVINVESVKGKGSKFKVFFKKLNDL